jgi:hypothetical protein
MGTINPWNAFPCRSEPARDGGISPNVISSKKKSTQPYHFLILVRHTGN